MHTCHYHHETPTTRKMSPAQEDLLRRVVATNGGGLSIYGENNAVVAGLVRRHFVQGKSGRQDFIVHTRDGLQWVRANAKQ